MRTAVALLAKIMYTVAAHSNELRLASEHVLAMRILGTRARCLDGTRCALYTCGYGARTTHLVLCVEVFVARAAEMTHNVGFVSKSNGVVLQK